MKVKKFSALHADRSAIHTSIHCLPQCQSQYKIASYGPAQYQHPPFNILRFAPGRMLMAMGMEVSCVYTFLGMPKMIKKLLKLLLMKENTNS